MKSRLGKFLLVALLAIPAGCEPRPVVVDPDGDTTIIKEDDADVDIVPDRPTTQPDNGVDVRVGGGEGVDVRVDPGPDTTGTPPSTPDADRN